MTANRDEDQGGAAASLGPREASVMRILWRQPDRHLSVRQVKDALDAGLAYTTVMTLLTRLHRKGHVERQLEGRAWTYRPVLTSGQHAATTMTAVLHDSDDRADVLFHFVGRLTPGEQQSLRRRLEDHDAQEHDPETDGP